MPAVRDYKLKDATLITSLTLPAGFSATNSLSILGVTSPTLDLKNGKMDWFEAQRCEFQLSIPSQNGAQMPTSAVINYSVYSALNSDGTSASLEYNNLIQTIAVSAATTGISVAATVVNFRVRTSVNRYLFLAASSPTSATAANTSVAQLAIVF